MKTPTTRWSCDKWGCSATLYTSAQEFKAGITFASNGWGVYQEGVEVHHYCPEHHTVGQ